MNVGDLLPQPRDHETFRFSRLRYVPESPGCYALTTFDGTILYVGLAANLRRRMTDHLNNPLKTKITLQGRAILFYWYTTDDLNKVERTWMNTHEQHEGKLPALNRLHSPILG